MFSMQGEGAARDRWVGIALVALSATAYSTAGFFTRLITVELWSLIFWRACFSALFCLGLLLLTDRRGLWRGFARLGPGGWGAVACSTAAMFCYLASLRLTSVAHVAVIYGASPFVTAAIAWLLLQERVTRTTLAASALALAGVAVMVVGTKGAGAANLAGDLLALAMTLLMAGMTVLLRRHAAIGPLHMTFVCSAIAAIFALPLAWPAEAAALDLGWLALFGVGQVSLGLTCLTLGARRLPAAVTALVATLDVPLAPLWVWLAFAERPTAADFLGGGLVLLAVVGHVALDTRRRR